MSLPKEAQEDGAAAGTLGVSAINSLTQQMGNYFEKTMVSHKRRRIIDFQNQHSSLRNRSDSRSNSRKRAMRFGSRLSSAGSGGSGEDQMHVTQEQQVNIVAVKKESTKVIQEVEHEETNPNEQEHVIKQQEYREEGKVLVINAKQETQYMNSMQDYRNDTEASYCPEKEEFYNRYIASPYPKKAESDCRIDERLQQKKSITESQKMRIANSVNTYVEELFQSANCRQAELQSSAQQTKLEVPLGETQKANQYEPSQDQQEETPKRLQICKSQELHRENEPLDINRQYTQEESHMVGPEISKQDQIDYSDNNANTTDRKFGQLIGRSGTLEKDEGSSNLGQERERLLKENGSYKSSAQGSNLYIMVVKNVQSQEELHGTDQNQPRHTEEGNQDQSIGENLNELPSLEDQVEAMFEFEYEERLAKVVVSELIGEQVGLLEKELQGQQNEKEFDNETKIEGLLFEELFRELMGQLTADFEEKLSENAVNLSQEKLEQEYFGEFVEGIGEMVEGQVAEYAQAQVFQGIANETIKQLGNDIEGELEQEIGDKATGKTLEVIVQEESSLVQNDHSANEVVPSLAVHSTQDVISQELISESIELEGVIEVVLQELYQKVSEGYIKEALEVSYNEREEEVAEGLVNIILKILLHQEIVNNEQDIMEIAEDQVAETATKKASKKTIKALYSEVLEEQQDSLFQAVVDKLVGEVEGQIIGRIMHEIYCIYEVTYIDSLIDNLCEIVHAKLIGSFLEIQITKEQQSQVKKIKLQKPDKSLNTSKEVQLKDLSEPKIKKIKKKNIKNLNAPNYMQIINPSPSFFGSMTVEELLDLDFFEKCFFGKKLSTKDQLIFRVYARELLELIKQNINKQIVKKQRQLSNQQQQQSFKQTQKKAKSKSPLIKQRQTNFQRDNTYSYTPPPGARKDNKLSKDPKEQSVDNISCLNITINKDMEKTQDFSKMKNDENLISFPQPQGIRKSQERRGTLSIPRVADISSPRLHEEQKVYEEGTNDDRRHEEYHYKISDKNLHKTIPEQPQQTTKKSSSNHSKQTLSPLKNVPKTNIQTYINLESQMKDLLNKKDKKIAMVRKQRRAIHNVRSEIVSPHFQNRHSDLSPTQDSVDKRFDQKFAVKVMPKNANHNMDDQGGLVSSPPSIRKNDELPGKKNLNERYYGKASVDSNHQFSDRNNKPTPKRQVSSQHAPKNSSQMPFILSSNIEGLNEDGPKNASKAKLKKIKLKQGTEGLHDSKQVIAIGTPKRSVQEVLDSARNYVQVDGPKHAQHSIQVPAKNGRSKSQIRSIPKKAFNSASESMHLVGPFVNQYLSKYGNGQVEEEDYASKTIMKKEKKRRIPSQLRTAQVSPKNQTMFSTTMSSMQKVADLRLYKKKQSPKAIERNNSTSKTRPMM